MPYFLPGAEREDVLQEGRIGLMKAVRDYNAGMSVSFRYFAEMCIRRNIITTVKKSTRQKHQALNCAQSLDKPFKDDANSALSLHDTLADARLADHAQALVVEELTAELRAAVVDGLTDLECRVLLEYMRGYTYAEVAQRLGMKLKACDNAMQRVKRKITIHAQDVLRRYQQV